MPSFRKKIAVVVIGRNEGDRLMRCLSSLKEFVQQTIYVDSGSTDDSVKLATSLGATVVALDTKKKFTAARARNIGFEKAQNHFPSAEYIQFVDGDCEVVADWFEKSIHHLATNERVAVVCGRRRERYPSASVYNRLIDIEWDTPIGDAKSCGGDALMRIEALSESGGFNPNLIAGEEPELCVRLRGAGWKISRLNAEMTLHDANLTHFRQWWKRAKRCGYAYAEGCSLHGQPPERHFRNETIRALVWGVFVPLLTLSATVATPWWLLLLLIWPAQVFRLWLKNKDWQNAFFLTIAKVPEALGCLEFYWNKLFRRDRSIIEYK